MANSGSGGSESLEVLVRLRARPEQVAAAETALHRIVDPTRSNPDCLEFRVLHSKDDPRVFVLFERWVSAQANLGHAQRGYMAEYMAVRDQLFEDIDGEFVRELDAIA